MKSIGIELPYSRFIKSLQVGEGHKYLGMFEADTFLGEQIKVKVPKEYFRRLKSKLNGGNLV